MRARRLRISDRSSWRMSLVISMGSGIFISECFSAVEAWPRVVVDHLRDDRLADPKSAAASHVEETDFQVGIFLLGVRESWNLLARQVLSITLACLTKLAHHQVTKLAVAHQAHFPAEPIALRQGFELVARIPESLIPSVAMRDLGERIEAIDEGVFDFVEWFHGSSI